MPSNQVERQIWMMSNKYILASIFASQIKSFSTNAIFRLTAAHFQVTIQKKKTVYSFSCLEEEDPVDDFPSIHYFIMELERNNFTYLTDFSLFSKST